VELLISNAFGPDGSPGLRGQEPPPSWPEEFLDDLRAADPPLLVDAETHPALTVDLDDLSAAHEATKSHDPDDVLAATADARVRHAAREAGRHDIYRTPVNVSMDGRAVREREADA